MNIAIDISDGENSMRINLGDLIFLDDWFIDVDHIHKAQPAVVTEGQTNFSYMQIFLSHNEVIFFDYGKYEEPIIVKVGETKVIKKRDTREVRASVMEL